jgi:hypothetical protein
MAVIFPDLEPLVISHIVSELAANDVTDVHVAAKRLPPGTSDAPANQIVVQVNYENLRDKVLRNANLMLEVFSDNFAYANELSQLVVAITPTIIGDDIKLCDVSFGPQRLPEESNTEKRGIAFDMVIKGTNL